MKNIKLVIYSKILNHHQAYPADELYRLTDSQFRFVELTPCRDMKGSATDFSGRPYLVQAWKSHEQYAEAMTLARTAEVCVFSGYEALPFEKQRLALNLLSFDMGERLLKRGLLNLASPRIFRMVAAYHFNGWRHKPLYKLCCGDFAASDCRRLGMFRDRCFRWGYFSRPCGIHDREKAGNESDRDSAVKLMWCGRFLKWKHPGTAVEAAKILRDRGLAFQLDIYGDVPREAPARKVYGREALRNLIGKYGLESAVTLKGVLDNEEIIEAMSRHDVFLLTSDKNEGWGVVASEALSAGCVLIASAEAGCSPSLVEEGRNGFTFRTRDAAELADRIARLIQNPPLMRQMQRDARSMMRQWEPAEAARRLIDLTDNIRDNASRLPEQGPCSPI